MSSTAEDEGQGGQFGAKEGRTCGLLLAAILFLLLLFLVWTAPNSVWQISLIFVTAPFA